MPGDEEEDLRSRTDARKERKASEDRLADLAEALVGLTRKQLLRLELDEVLFGAIEEAQRMPNPRARARQLRVVRRSLRDGPVDRLEEELLFLAHPELTRAGARIGHPLRLLDGPEEDFV
ncbi:MAG: DUF615 domain-containing protein, partial [Myxococcota bacterium]